MKKSLLVLLVSFAISLLFCRILIPMLRKWKAGQNILSYVKEHKTKSGTPTMCGLAFVGASVVACALFATKSERALAVSIAVGISYMIVGLLDDILKKKHKQNLGLRAWQKCTFQAFIALFCAIFAYQQGMSYIRFPFTQKGMEIGAWIIPLVIFVFLATVNGVNLTDGLDGLAAGVSVPFFAVIGGLILLQGTTTQFPILCFAIVGALTAYLLFNAPPASVFMGDTGSLALGGFAASVCAFSGNILYIAVVGLPFVFSVLSVVIQVIYYKVTGGKRVFLMSPLHHHFQMKGYSESKISYSYFLISCLLGVACFIAYL